MSDVASPCTGVCAIDAVSDVCAGCLRTLDEIAAWGSSSDDEKLALLAALAQRQHAPPHPFTLSEVEGPVRRW